MIKIMMRQKDGYEIYDEADNLREAIQTIEDEAINIAECNWPGDYDKIFPIFWECCHVDNPGYYESGFIDEYGNTF